MEILEMVTRNNVPTYVVRDEITGKKREVLAPNRNLSVAPPKPRSTRGGPGEY